MDWFGDFYHAYTGSMRMVSGERSTCSARNFLDCHAFFRCPFASIDDMSAASSGGDNGVSESDINGFYELMAKDHRHGRARDDLRKGKYTI